MPFDMIEAMTMIAREKNIEFEAVLETLQQSLLAAAKKKYDYTDNITFRFDRKNSDLIMMAVKKVVDEVEDKNTEISLKEAQDIDKEAVLGDEIDIYIDYEVEFGRNAIASAKQMLIQKVREAERDRIYDEYVDKVGTLASGVVQQVDKGNVIVNLGRGEAILPIREQIPREKFRQGDRIRALILDLQREARGPQIILSRVAPDFVQALFALEVPEIYERVIEIKAIAREPGERTKIAVYSSDDRIDPVGACVGIKGVRVQAIVRELNNERIDIVPYSSNPEMFVTRALAPARVVNIDLDMEQQAMTVAVEDEKLSLAIGRAGQNARLASKLTGWKVNILSETQYNDNRKRDAELLVPIGELEGVGPKLQERLIEADIPTVQRLAETTPEALEAVEGLGEKTALQLLERAKELQTKLESEWEEKRAEREEADQKDAADSETTITSASQLFHDDVGEDEESAGDEETSDDESVKDGEG
jgi:N utilization substance protein A